jgi:hypothetical protein
MHKFGRSRRIKFSPCLNPFNLGFEVVIQGYLQTLFLRLCCSHPFDIQINSRADQLGKLSHSQGGAEFNGWSKEIRPLIP